MCTDSRIPRVHFFGRVLIASLFKRQKFEAASC